MARKRSKSSRSDNDTQDEVLVVDDSVEEETVGKTYVIKSLGLTHKGVVMNIGDEITPRNEAQAEFLKSQNII